MQRNHAMHIPILHTTRILSVFSLLKRVGFALLLLGGNAFAQPFDVLWDRSGQGPESGYGAQVFSLGDQNNDGFMDWGVSAQGLVAGDPSESIGEFFYGGNPPQSIPYHTWTADPGVYLRFVIVRPMGDLDGDGFIDWKVEFQPLQNTQTIEIGFYLGGPDATFEPFLQLSRPLRFSRIIPMGDFNGDGFDDIFAEGIQPHPDGYFLFGGELMDTIPDWLATRENFGMLTSGDVNGDGIIDFLSDGSDIYLGSANPDTAPAYHWGGGISPYLSWIIPDINGDGKDDMAAAEFEHRVNIYLGADTVSNVPTVTLNFQGCPEGGIYRVVGLSDINGDNVRDFAVIDDICINSWGAVAMYLGYHWINPNPIATIRGRTEPYELVGIFSAAGLGDVNGDEVGDFIVGAFNDDFDGERGRAVVFAGSDEYVVPANDAPVFPDELEVSVYPNPFNSSATVSLELPYSARSVTLTLFNTLGQEVRREELNFITSSMQYRLDGQGLSTGLYFLTVRAGESIATQKVMLLK